MPRPRQLKASFPGPKASKTANFSDELPQLNVSSLIILIGPLPRLDLWQVLAGVACVLASAQPRVGHQLADVRRARRQAREPIDNVHYEVEAVEIIHHHHIEGSRCRALLDVTADVNVVMVCPAISQAMNEPGVSMEGEDYRPRICKEGIELGVRHPVWVLARRF